MNFEETKYEVGDIFIRTYNGIDWLCILMSRDYEKSHNRFVWRSAMLMMLDGDLGGGKPTEYYEEDLDNMIKVGRMCVYREYPKHSVDLAGSDSNKGWLVGFVVWQFPNTNKES